MDRQLPNSLVRKPARVVAFATSLGAAARLFSLEQVARHPDLSSLSQPVKRASEIICAHPELFEKLDGPRNKPARWRLTSKAKRDLNIKQKAVPGVSTHAEHWLGIGDIWLALTFYGGRPEAWKVDPHHQFDIFCNWQGRPYLIEYQRTPITTKDWRQKWSARLEWYKAQTWETKPAVVLVATTNQQPDTMQIPKGTIFARSPDELPRLLRKK